ncbi:NUDIX domain-containing protein [Nanoarchaeota archaeon]
MRKDQDPKQKLKEVACTILYDKDKKVLLQHRTKYTKRLPCYWAFFGGSVNKGETPNEAAKREAFEELNFISRNPKLVLQQKFTLLEKNYMKNVFIERCEDKSNLKLQEGQDWGWYDIEDTKKLKMIFHDREALQHIKEILNRHQKK